MCNMRRRALLAANTNRYIIDINNYLTIEALEDGLTVKVPMGKSEYCIDGDGNWIELSKGSETEAINKNQIVSFRANWNGSTNSSTYKFTINKLCNLKGDPISLYVGDNASETASYPFDNTFSFWFYNNPIVDASSLNLSRNPRQGTCYYMFYNCYELKKAPELPASVLAYNCYNSMFQNCRSLVNAPELPATTLTGSCYNYMFNGCINLNYIKALCTDTPSRSCTMDWVKGVSSTGTFVKHPEATWDVRGVDGVPEGWTIKFDGEEEDEGSIIQFKIDGWSYTAIEGMTWEQWVNSSYYDHSYGGLDIYIVENTVYVYTDTGDWFLIGQNGDDVIIEDTRYELYGPVPAPEL